MPKARKICPYFLSAVLALGCCIAFAADPSPVRLPDNDTIALGADDALEFTLTTPPSEEGARPDVNVWILKSTDAAPGANTLANGKAYIWPSPRRGEYLVHIRGLKPPEIGAMKWDLLIRWSLPNQKSGEVRFPGRLVFKADAADVVLLMDGSLSMGRNDPKRLRVDAARDFIDAARRTGSIGRIAIIQFDSKSRTVLPLTPVTESFEKALLDLDERGQTDIDGGIRHSLDLLHQSGLTGTVGAENKSIAGASIVLLTDGQQEPGVYRDAHDLARKAGVAVHTLALGREADRTLLKRIAADTGGTFADASKDKDLTLAYAAIASRISRSRTILNTTLNANGPAAAVPVDGSCRALALGIGSDNPGVLSVRGPANESWSSPSQIRPEYFLELPKEGQWQADWKSGAGDAVQLSASARTALFPLFFRSEPQPNAPVEIDTDEPNLALSLSEADAPLAGASVEVTLQFSENAALPKITAQLFDDGEHDDGAPGDGIYAAYLPPLQNANGAYPDGAQGTIATVVTGKRGGADFRREITSTFTFKRHDGAALIVSGPIDFGTRFAGETANTQVNLRVRGGGGALGIDHSAGQRDKDLSAAFTIETPLTSLKPRERTKQSLRVAVPEIIEPGTYGGVIEFKLAGADTVKVPWRVQVLAPQLQVPAAIDLGGLQPGERMPVQLSIRTGGGTLSVYSITLEAENDRDFFTEYTLAAANSSALMPQPLRMLRQNAGAITCTTESANVDLDFDVATDARARGLSYAIVYRDIARRELARTQLSARVLGQHLTIDAPLAFGPVETGDTAERPMRWKWNDRVSDPAHPAAARKPPVNAALRILDNPALPWPGVSLSAPEIVNGAATANFTLSIPADAKPGEITGWIAIEAGPVLAMRRWSAYVVQPSLAVNPAAIDFGTILPGNKRSKKIVLNAVGARPIAAQTNAAVPFAKPRIQNVTLPPNALAISKPSTEILPGSSETLIFELDVPDGVQDGLYRTNAEISSRLGKISVPLSVTVTNDITPTPFHVSPSSLLLSFRSAAALPAEKVRITSHRDEDIALDLALSRIAGTENAKLVPPAAFLLPDSPVASLTRMNVTLPPRATIEITVQATPEARSGESCNLSISGADERQNVDILIERGPVTGVKLIDQPAMLDWLLLLLLLIALLLAMLLRRLIRKNWVRYAMYSALFHLAFLPWMMPREKLIDALPATMQISLLESDMAMGHELSEQQVRRLEALRAESEPDSPNKPATARTLTDNKPETALPEPETKKADEAPAASALEALKPQEASPNLTQAPETQRAAAKALQDEPLKIDAQLPDPAPAPQKPPEVAQVQPRSIETNRPVINEPLPPALPSPSPARTVDAADTDLPLSASLPDPQPQKVPAPEILVRPAREQPLAADAPLAIESLTPAAKAPAPTPTNLESAERDAPVLALAALKTAPAPAPVATDVPAAAKAAPARTEALAPAAMSTEPTREDSDSNKTLALATRAFTDVAFDTDAALDAGALEPSLATAKSGAATPRTEPLTPREGSALAGTAAKSGGKEWVKEVGIGQPASTSAAASKSGSALERSGLALSGGIPKSVAQSENGAGTRRSVTPGAGTGLDGDAPLAIEPLPGGTPTAAKTTTAADGTGKFAPQSAPLATGFAPGGTGAQVALGVPKLTPGNGAATQRASTLPPSNNAQGTGTARSGDAPVETVRRPNSSPGTEGDLPLIAQLPEPGRGQAQKTTGNTETGKLEKDRGGPVASGAPTPGTPFRGSDLAGLNLGGVRSGTTTGTERNVTAERKLPPALGSGPGSSTLELQGLTSLMKSVRGSEIPTRRLINGATTGAHMKYNMGLAKHAGDWNSSPTALHHLRSAFIERSSLPELEVNVKKFELSSLRDMLQCRMVLVTSNQPIAFTPAEIQAMRDYIKAGGTLWVNDSSASDSDLFDKGFRPVVSEIVPGAKLVSLEMEHPFFKACYDLSKGFKGFRVPPGDKYRQNYIEALLVDDGKEKARAGIIYTRNDYADGLEIDPRMDAGMKSLTDLTNAEMQEASLRFGMNLIAYSLGSDAMRLPPPPDSIAAFEKIYRYNGPPLPPIDDFTVERDQWQKQIWYAETEWCNPTEMWVVDDKEEKSKVIAVRFNGGTKFKAAVARNIPQDLSGAQAIVFDLHSSVGSGFNVALLFTAKDGKAYETRPVFVRPGWNRNLRFPLNLGDTKSSASAKPWQEYDTSFEPRNNVERMTVLIYNLGDSGAVKIGPIKTQK